MRANIGKADQKKIGFELNSLRRHAIILGTTGSGKTVMAKALLEEALIKGIPVIAIDPKGDIGSLGIVKKDFDFRPYSGSKSKSTSIARKYLELSEEFGLTGQDLSKLLNIKTTIYTPKSDSGRQVSLMPSLDPPKQIDPEFVEAIAGSLMELAKIKNEKLKSLVATIILDAWDKKDILTVHKIIEQVINPNFKKIGSLDIDEFLSVKERQKMAASLNILLSSPALRAWETGKRIDIPAMLKKNQLSVFDMRFSPEKQFVAEQVLSSLYRHLLSLGGSKQLRGILYIDELAGLLPLPPANPPCKKMLEILIRQARAFGLGIVVATQSPGDVDYRILGNIGTRFIGKLRTKRDIEKVASAMESSSLSSDMTTLKTGEFILNDAVKNKNQKIKARWLYSYHEGPLNEKQIRWVNEGVLAPDDKLDIMPRPISNRSRTTRAEKKEIKIDEMLKSIKSDGNNRDNSAMRRSERKLAALIKSVRSYASKTDIKITISKNRTYTPYLRLYVDISIRNLLRSDYGPHIFNLTGDILPVHKRLNSISWSRYIPKGTEIAKTKNIKRYFDYFRCEAKDILRTEYFESTILRFLSTNREEVEQNNFNHIMDSARLKMRQLDERSNRLVRDIEQKISKNRQHISRYQGKLASSKAKRMIKRIFVRKINHTTKEHKTLARKIENLKRENSRLGEKIARRRAEYERRKDVVRDKAYIKAHTCVKKKIFRPANKDLSIQATILLLPK